MEETVKQGLENFLDALSNSGPAIRLYSDGRATHPKRPEKRPILRRKTMRKRKVGAIAIKSFALLVVLSAAYQAMAQDATTPYPNMAPIEQYLMDRTAEIALRAAQHRSPFHAMQRSWFLDVIVSKQRAKAKWFRVCRGTFMDFRT
jgi:hypothetical protein